MQTVTGTTVSVEQAADLMVEHSVVSRVVAPGLIGTVLQGVKNQFVLIQGVGDQLLRLDIQQPQAA